MLPAAGQLSLIDAPQVTIEYHPERQPPDAAGPFEWGAFSAKLAGVYAWGRTEDLVLAEMAKSLRELVEQSQERRGLSPLDQALAAAEVLPTGELAQWLKSRATPAAIYGPAVRGQE